MKMKLYIDSQYSSQQLSFVWDLKHHISQPLYIFNRARVLHLDRLKEGTWLLYLAGGSKTAPRILIFFNCHRCRIFILYEIHCYLSLPQSWHNNSSLGSVCTIHLASARHVPWICLLIYLILHSVSKRNSLVLRSSHADKPNHFS